MSGDFLSIAAAQFALETGRGQAPGRGGQLWRDGLNPWCIKAARDARFQASKTADGYAVYGSLQHAWADRLRILIMYREWCLERGHWYGDVLQMLDTWWAPGQGYASKLHAIIKQESLYLLDQKPSL